MKTLSCYPDNVITVSFLVPFLETLAVVEAAHMRVLIDCIA
jgi:hypothetical protein